MKDWVVGTDIGGTFTDVIGINLKTGRAANRQSLDDPP